jgi:hypothetical protein
MFARFARLLTGLIALGSALAGCGPSYKPTVSEQLKPKTIPRCTAIFDGDRFGGSPTSGSVRGPAVAVTQLDFRQVEEKYRDGSNPLTDWWSYDGLMPSRAEAKTVDGVQTLFCIRQVYIQIGIYRPDNIAAVRQDWDVRVVRWPSGEPMASMVIRGPEPPQDIKKSAGDNKTTYYAGSPDNEAKRWLDEVIAR